MVGTNTVEVDVLVAVIGTVVTVVETTVEVVVVGMDSVVVLPTIVVVVTGTVVVAENVSVELACKVLVVVDVVVTVLVEVVVTTGAAGKVFAALEKTPGKATPPIAKTRMDKIANDPKTNLFLRPIVRNIVFQTEEEKINSS